MSCVVEVYIGLRHLSSRLTSSLFWISLCREKGNAALFIGAILIFLSEIQLMKEASLILPHVLSQVILILLKDFLVFP